ncbi:nucleotidyltransferase family protein [Aquifex sp.]
MLKKPRKEILTLEDLREFLKEFFKDKQVEVYLFGSRAKGNFSEFSDVDIAVYSQEDISEEVTLLREILEESNFPLKVDIVELNRTPYLKEVIKREGIRWI